VYGNQWSRRGKQSVGDYHERLVEGTKQRLAERLEKAKDGKAETGPRDLVSFQTERGMMRKKRP
jgi:hypothetical protein